MPSFTSWIMSRLVAEISRKLTLTGFLAPTGSISPSCSARSSFTCASSGSSPISSRNSVPPSASWNLPMRLSTAPVNEPFSWPNRMLSTRFSGMAPQLTVTNGFARALALALDGARDQLLADAAFRLRSARGCWRRRRGLPSAMTRCMASPRMMRSAKVSVPSAFFLMRRDLARQRLDLQGAFDRDFEPLGRRRLDHEVDGAGAHGADGGVDRAVGGLHDDRAECQACRRAASRTPMPSMPGMTRSSSTREMAARSGPSRICRACSPRCAVLVSKPRRLMVSSRMRRWAGSSSTIRTRLAMGTYSTRLEYDAGQRD